MQVNLGTILEFALQEEFSQRKHADGRLLSAAKLAYEAHDGQFRKYGNLPYIVHPRQVYQRVSRLKIESPERHLTMLCAAWLHDVKEDCPQITDQQIIEASDNDALVLVCELTNPSKGSTANRATRKQMDRDHLKVVSVEAKIIKLVDRICNLGDMLQCPDKDFAKLYARESRLLLEILADADADLAKELEALILEIEKQ